MSHVVPSVVTRFAPSPTGELHLGSAYSALDRLAAGARGRRPFLLRIEDIDIRRCRREFETAILRGPELARPRLGRRGAPPVRSFRRLRPRARPARRARPDLSLLLQPRRDRARDRRVRQRRRHGPDGPLYPGTCRHLVARRTPARASRPAASTACGSMRRARQRQAGPYRFRRRAPRAHRRPAAAAGRLRARAQGHADQLSPLGHGRRSSAGRDPGDARRGHAAVDPRPCPAAAPAGLRDAALCPSRAADRRRPAGASPSATGTSPSGRCAKAV